MPPIPPHSRTPSRPGASHASARTPRDTATRPSSPDRSQDIPKDAPQTSLSTGEQKPLAGGNKQNATGIEPGATKRPTHDVGKALDKAIAASTRRFGHEQQTMAHMQQAAFARGLPFLVLAHVPKYGPPSDIRPCSAWCSDQESAAHAAASGDFSLAQRAYGRSQLFVMQHQSADVIDMGLLGRLQDPAHPKRSVTAFLQLNESEALQEAGRDSFLRALAGSYLITEHPKTCAALGARLSEAIAQHDVAWAYTDALVCALGDRNIKLALHCLRSGASLTGVTEQATTPLIEATLRAPIVLLRRVLKEGARAEHLDDLKEAQQIAQDHHMRDRAEVLAAHIDAIEGG